MKNLLVQLRVNGKLDITDDIETRDLRIIRSLLEKIHLNVVDFIEYKDISEDNSANNDRDNKPTLFEDETIVHVVLSVEPENETFFDDDGHNLLKYIGDALDFRPSRISNYTERDDNGFTETTIEITVGEVIDGIARTE